jgi:hypothetical protein
MKRAKDDGGNSPKKQKLEDDEDTLEQPESESTFKDLTCSICLEPHTTDNLTCRQCGQSWHRECLANVNACPNCRGRDGYVKTRSYDELIKIITTKALICNYCHLAVPPAEYPQAHLGTCEKYRYHLARRQYQLRKVLYKAMELNVPQDPIDLSTKDLPACITIQVPDLRSTKRNIFLDLLLESASKPNHYTLNVRPTSSEHLPLHLSIQVADSLACHVQFIAIPDSKTQVQFELVLKAGVAARFWINCL